MGFIGTKVLDLRSDDLLVTKVTDQNARRYFVISDMEVGRHYVVICDVKI